MAGGRRRRYETVSPADAGPLAVRLARAALAVSPEALPERVVEKAKLCLLDLLGCAFEARDLPWSRQAIRLAATASSGPSGIIGTPYRAPSPEAAFANAVMGHGLVREDMHAASVSHLGVVVLPALLALAESRRPPGRDLLAAIVVGYEVGGRAGRALVDPELARLFRPTGLVGPLAAAAAGARLLRLGVDEAASALAFAANTAAGLNEWAHTGGSEMFFHPGFAARSGVIAVGLAELGAEASPTALDGPAGLFAAFGKAAAAAAVELFRGPAEILSVYHKPVPACNFAQSACQAALALAREVLGGSSRIVGITVRVPRAAAAYPGCDFAGPFVRRLQAKMSIQYNVAAALARARLSEESFARLDDPDLLRLVAVTRLEVDDALTRAFPGRQGAEVEVREADGSTRRARLDDVVPASPAEVRERFRAAAAAVVGAARAREIEAVVDRLEQLRDAGRLGLLIRAEAGDASAGDPRGARGDGHGDAAGRGRSRRPSR